MTGEDDEGEDVMIAVAVGLKQIVLWAVTTFIRFLQELGSLKSELGSLDLAGRLVQDPSPPAGKGPQGHKYLGPAALDHHDFRASCAI